MKPTRIIGKALLRAGVDVFNRSREDRRVLMMVILPEICRDPSVTRVLFVGCDYYTRPYESIFSGKEYWTIEPLEKLRRYGARRHVVDGIERLQDYFPPKHFDAIICNGVIGWGLNTPEEANAAFDTCFSSLRDGGLLLIGWADDGGARCPFPPEQCRSLEQFEKSKFRPLGTSRFVTATTYRHTFLFLRRPHIIAPAVAELPNTHAIVRQNK